ncbi:MAG TPA: hypothetical protein VNW46_17580 [Gemmatimonadaceae bacterium]|jgi:hypothetical protein|nr:hypothetical protein [Gemmatimonadaceae bacterium]
MRRWSAGLSACGVLSAALVGAACGSSSSPAGLSNGLVGPLTIAFREAHANPGDVVGFTVTLPGQIPPDAPLVLTPAFDGQRGKPDTTLVRANYGMSPPEGTTLTGTVSLADGFPDGTLTLTISLPDQHDSSVATLIVRDTIPPIVRGVMVEEGGLPFTVQMTTLVPMLVPGPTDTLAVYATDNQDVAWIGYAIGSPANIRDSVAAQGLGVPLNVGVPIPAAWVGGTPTITVFARDRDGNYTEQVLGTTAVAAHVTRPVRTAPIDTGVRRAVYDAKRHVVYLAAGDQPAIQVLSLASMTFGTPLPLPVPAVDLDLRPGGDSLVVALANSADLAVVNLAAAPGSPPVVHLNSLNGPGGDTTHVIGYISSVRVGSDGRALVSAGNNYVAQFDPATKTDTLEIQWQGPTALVRSGNGAKVLIVGALQYFTYDARAHSYTGVVSMTAAPAGPLSADSDGSYYAFSNQVFDASLNFLGWAPFPTVSVKPPSVMSASVTQLFVATPDPYYMRFQEPTQLNAGSGLVGVPLDVVDTPEPIWQFVQLADTTSLLAFGADKAMLFDLTQSSPAPSRAVRPPRVAARRAHPPAQALPSTLILHFHLGHQDHAFTLPRSGRGLTR